MKPVSGLGTELALFGKAVLWGTVMFVVYDILRVFRRIFPHGIVWISMEDLIYWIAASVFFFLRLCRDNDGIIRFYILLGLVAGAWAYDRLVSRRLMRWLTKIILSIKKQLKKIRKKVKMKLRVRKEPRNTEEKE
ncbi:MAG: spore cortex biosynthesis protein YabQ [Lachnospiraceae bacterium]|nr:spore cortex biosynthesis protein YabQ [Lachnospiraceae bacterium]